MLGRSHNQSFDVLTSSITFESSMGIPIRPLSCHSNMTKLTIGSSPFSRSLGFMNLMSMNGSVLPPHDAREYMPEHTCRLAFFWSCYGLSLCPRVTLPKSIHTTFISTACTLAASCKSSSPASLTHPFIFLLESRLGLRPADRVGVSRPPDFGV